MRVGVAQPRLAVLPRRSAGLRIACLALGREQQRAARAARVIRRRRPLPDQPVGSIDWRDVPSGGRRHHRCSAVGRQPSLRARLPVLSSGQQDNAVDPLNAYTVARASDSRWPGHCASKRSVRQRHGDERAGATNCSMVGRIRAVWPTSAPIGGAPGHTRDSKHRVCAGWSGDLVASALTKSREPPGSRRHDFGGPRVERSTNGHIEPTSTRQADRPQAAEERSRPPPDHGGLVLSGLSFLPLASRYWRTSGRYLIRCG